MKKKSSGRAALLRGLDFGRRGRTALRILVGQSCRSAPFFPSAGAARLTWLARGNPKARTSLRSFWRKFGRRSSAALPLLVAMILLAAVGATAETTNTLSDAEIQGHALVQKILEQQPTENFTNTGVLQIRDAKGKRVEIPVRFEISVTESNWQAAYRTQITGTNGDINFGRTYFAWLTIVHSEGQPNLYKVPNVNPPPTDTNEFFSLTGDQITTPFVARSDFWLADLGLEFFHWPQQKVLKKEFRRQCACMVLESTNPNPTTNGYSRVVSWIDEESLGIVEANAYDANGKKLKNFYPKNFEKVNGQYQVQSMIIDNLQTGSRSRLEFDLKK